MVMARLGASADQILVVQVYPNTLSQSDFVRPGSLSLSNTGSIPQTQNVNSRKSDVLEPTDSDRIMCGAHGSRWKVTEIGEASGYSRQNASTWMFSWNVFRHQHGEIDE